MSDQAKSELWFWADQLKEFNGQDIWHWPTKPWSHVHSCKFCKSIYESHVPDYHHCRVQMGHDVNIYLENYDTTLENLCFHGLD